MRTAALLAIAIVLSPAFLAAGKFNKSVDIGDAGHRWTDLEGTDGKRHSLADCADAKVVVVAFICNHCPIAKSYEPRFKAFVEAYRDQGVKFVAINCSSTEADRLEAMKARAAEQAFNFDYLYDPTQATARGYGALVTPHLFVLDADRKIAYMGAFDDHSDPDKVRRHYLKDAVDDLLAGKRPEVAESLQRGCGIVYNKR